MKRALYSLAVAAMAMWPLSAVASPSPSPSLESVLAPAPAAYTSPLTGPFSGHITASQFAQSWGQDAAQASSELNTDGYVDGFGLILADRASGRVMAEFALAFTGQSGALRFMGADNRRNVVATTYQHADTHTGLGQYYYGVHMASTTSPVLVLDGFEFVKGNDMFGVAFYSTKDDVLAIASAQAQKQFDSAPAATISSNDWPENQAPPNRSTFGDFSTTTAIAILALALLFGGGIFVAMRRREGARFAGVTQPQQQMSGDGNFWWGGSSWISINDVAPPWAQRSPDGAYWWDGRAWRPVPGAAQLTPR